MLELPGNLTPFLVNPKHVIFVDIDPVDNLTRLVLSSGLTLYTTLAYEKVKSLLGFASEVGLIQSDACK